MSDKAHEYRRQAELCTRFAEQMSLRDDRAKMIEMARRWLTLAQEAEAEGSEGPSAAAAGTMLQQQQPQPEKPET